VFGAGGGLGVHMLMIARWARARKVIAVDVMASKFETCLKCGADATVDASHGNVPQQLLDITNGEGVDVAIDYVSSTVTLEAGVRALGRRGRLVILGGSAKPFNAPARDMLTHEQSILGSRYVTRREILDVFDMVARREVWPLVTDLRPLEEAEAVHARVEKGEVTGRAALRIV
jgi:D-arabinose 1-dehydrogenase-like Zn-dependent alcohol dehydrogenase